MLFNITEPTTSFSIFDGWFLKVWVSERALMMIKVLFEAKADEADGLSLAICLSLLQKLHRNSPCLFL